MRLKISIILATFAIFGCGTSKKIKSSEKTHTKSEIVKESSKDSTTTIQETAPTENQIIVDLDKLKEQVGDFTQKITSGPGNESTIEKKGNKLIVTNKNAGSKNVETTVNEKSKEQRYDATYVIKELKVFVKRMPFWAWAILGLGGTIFFRKFIAQIAVAIFPGLGSYRLISLFLGNNKN